ncbi:TetR/AcrR family transcriptional regulator C-terminal domain-containing protein [Streptomyces fuscigenes]|uniref:TetR/AcrR family transcriptional regulator C-terminal domain-containing protein n=1 Tax=Streptomyces fuscigenes TaxID=1528880 RepID=UPI001F2426AA|nr:TetR/AcrR family transcriptional regulator C-terminal domain-containing protein [Streptomyces fuscigenes]MCF3965169.1 TetR/AcrR family transcriptional regulator C-terminal domain-containing protein [Streptomyces fuscigenes]
METDATDATDVTDATDADAADITAGGDRAAARATAPYRRIVGELRRRIESGELPPGARVPSTRALVREHGVAMATATKVLTELRHAGLVRAVPGVGTVVAPAAAPRAAAPDAAHSTSGTSDPSGTSGPSSTSGTSGGTGRSGAPGPSGTSAGAGAVVAAAVAVADAEGIDAVSMRRLAADLGMATMSLYRHVGDKDDLVLRMLDAAFAEAPLPPPSAAGPGSGGAGWRARLEVAATSLWALFRRHPWLAPALSLTRPQAIPHALPYTEAVLAALSGRGLDTDTMFTVHLTLFNYVRGTAVNLESEAAAEAATGLDSEAWLDTQEGALEAGLGSGAFPEFRRLLAEGYAFDLDELFAFGLGRLLDGIAPLVEGPRR